MHDEDSGHFWRGALIVLLVAGVVTGLVGVAWYTGRGPFAGRPARAAAAPVSAPASVPAVRAIAAADPGAAAAACTAGITDAAAPAAGRLTAAPGRPVSIAVRCPAGATVVDLVVVLPAPAGVQGVLVTEAGAEENGMVEWTWAGATPSVTGVTVSFYPYVDGRPAAAPVLLQIE